MKKMIEVKNVDKSYPRFCLSDVSFELPVNTITGLVGRNGAGKTTTLKLLLGYLKRDSGTIKVLGLDIDTPKNIKKIRNKIGIVMEKNPYYESFTIKQMKTFLSAAYDEWNDEVFYENIAKFKLNEKQKIEELSRGMRIKLSLAFAFSHNADILIMDEPTSGLDPVTRSEILELLEKFCNIEGKAVLLSTHICADLEKIANNIILMNEGRIVLDMGINHILGNLGRKDKVESLEEILMPLMNGGGYNG